MSIEDGATNIQNLVKRNSVRNALELLRNPTLLNLAETPSRLLPKPPGPIAKLVLDEVRDVHRHFLDLGGVEFLDITEVPHVALMIGKGVK